MANKYISYSLHYLLYIYFLPYTQCVNNCNHILPDTHDQYTKYSSPSYKMKVPQNRS